MMDTFNRNSRFLFKVNKIVSEKIQIKRLFGRQTGAWLLGMAKIISFWG